jgi:minor extracellular protease Epr
MRNEAHRLRLTLGLTVAVLCLITTLFFPTVVGNYTTTTQEVIICFTNTPDLQLLAKYNVTVLEIFSIIPAVHAIVPSNVVTQLEKNPAIECITENSPTQITGTIIEDYSNWPEWPLQLIEAPTAWTESNGTGIKIAILDTGIAPINDLSFHVGYNYVNRNNNTLDQNGHGTMIASLIATQHTSPTGLKGVAPEVELYAVKVLNDQGRGSISQAISGIDWAVRNGMQVISMSWGSTSSGSLSLERAIDAAYNSGVLLVAAAGNDGATASSGVAYPARYDSVIAVSAISEYKNKLGFSSFGPEVELTAPGENIWAIGPNNKIWSGNGTSFAVPYVTGAAALIWAKNNSLTNTDVRNILWQTATNLQSDGRDTYFGYGLINATAAIYAQPQNISTLEASPNTSTETPNNTPTISAQDSPTTKPRITNNQQPTNPPTTNSQQPTNTNPASLTDTQTNPLDISHVFIIVVIILNISILIIILATRRHNIKDKDTETISCMTNFE